MDVSKNALQGKKRESYFSSSPDHQGASDNIIHYFGDAVHYPPFYFEKFY
jgi:hypothetical protein